MPTVPIRATRKLVVHFRRNLVLMERWRRIGLMKLASDSLENQLGASPLLPFELWGESAPPTCTLTQHDLRLETPCRCVFRSNRPIGVLCLFVGCKFLNFSGARQLFAFFRTSHKYQ